MELPTQDSEIEVQSVGEVLVAVRRHVFSRMARIDPGEALDAIRELLKDLPSSIQ